jgi:DNA-binding transcriptional LysR family regulator
MTALLDIDQLRTFIAIAETGSFTRAADVVHKTQSAVSMQMKRLEERLGKPIFERDGRASKLTDDGERLLDWRRREAERGRSHRSPAWRHGSARLGVPGLRRPVSARIMALRARIGVELPSSASRP